MIFINIFNLFGKLTLDNSDYKNKIEESKQKNNEFAGSTQKMSGKSVIAWGAILTIIIMVLNKVKDLILETANYADQIGDLAEKWGFTTQQIQEFDYWATMSGTTLESLLTAMRGLVNQAEAGSNAFRKLGVNVKNTDGTFKDQRTLFLETIDALQKVENQTERNALQFEIFGRSGIELGQIINRDAKELEELSREAENLGIILSKNTINQASEFNDKLDQMKLAFKSVMAEIIAGSPDAEEKFTQFLDNLVERFDEWGPRFVKIVVNLLGKLVKAFYEIVGQLPSVIIDALMSIDWIQLGADIANGLIKGFINILSTIFGRGWLWGKDENNSQNVEILNTENAISTINNVGSVERTEKIEETLDITLRVESDGTKVSEENLNIVSDLVVDKINEILGGEV